MINDLHEEFSNLKSDMRRWEWVIKNKGEGITLMLDNDCTYLHIEGMDDYDDNCGFDWYLGNSQGAFDLLLALGINAEDV